MTTKRNTKDFTLVIKNSPVKVMRGVDYGIVPTAKAGYKAQFRKLKDKDYFELSTKGFKNADSCRTSMQASFLRYRVAPNLVMVTRMHPNRKKVCFWIVKKQKQFK